MRSQKRETAKKLLLHYLKLASEGEELAFSDPDCIVEIEGIIDDCVEAAKEEILNELRTERLIEESAAYGNDCPRGACEM